MHLTLSHYSTYCFGRKRSIIFVTDDINGQIIVLFLLPTQIRCCDKYTGYGYIIEFIGDMHGYFYNCSFLEAILLHWTVLMMTMYGQVL